MSSNTLIHRIVRPAVRLIAPTRIRPNHITTVRLITGVGAALCFATNRDPIVMTGCVLMMLSIFLDRADGELARQTGRSSRFGHLYDLFSDCLSNALAFIGLGYAALHTPMGGLGLFFGGVTAVGIAALFWEFNGLRLSKVPSLTVGDQGILFDADDAMVIVPVLVWVDLDLPMLVVAAIATSAGAIWMAVAKRNLLGRKRDRQAI